MVTEVQTCALPISLSLSASARRGRPPTWSQENARRSERGRTSAGHSPTSSRSWAARSPGARRLRQARRPTGRPARYHATHGGRGTARVGGRGPGLSWRRGRSIRRGDRRDGRGRGGGRGVIRAARLPDPVAYVTGADSVGDFRLPELEPGRYRVIAIQDQNGNRALDRREAFDTATVTLDTAAHVVLWTFVHDSAGPRLRTVDLLDSTSLRLSFSQPLDPATPLDTARVRVFALPDSTPVAVK